MALLTTILWINLGFAAGLACGILCRIGGAECGPHIVGEPVPDASLAPHGAPALPDCLRRLNGGMP